MSVTANFVFQPAFTCSSQQWKQISDNDVVLVSIVNLEQISNITNITVCVYQPSYTYINLDNKNIITSFQI